MSLMDETGSRHSIQGLLRKGSKVARNETRDGRGHTGGEKK
jgi:hypothetical protein